MRVYLRVAILGLVLSTGVESAMAQSDAEKLRVDALAARDRGEWAPALELFRQSYALEPKKSKLLNIAQCEEQLGKLRDALGHYREVSKQYPLGKEGWTFAVKHIQGIEQRIPWLTVKFDKSPPVGVVVSVDGSMIPAESLGREVPVDPGKHIIKAAAPGLQDWQTEIELREKQRVEIAIPFTRQIVPSVVSNSSDRLRVAGIVSFTAGAAFFGVMSGVGVAANSESEACSMGKPCQPNDLSQIHDKMVKTNVFLGLGIAACVAGTTLFVVRAALPTNASPEIAIIPTGMGGALRIRY